MRYIFVLFFLYSCKDHCNKWQKGNIVTNYSLPIKLGNKVNDSISNTDEHSQIKDQDSFHLRFLSQFSNEDISVYFECNKHYKTIEKVTTNESLMLANSTLSIPKNPYKKIIVVIDGFYYPISIEKDYMNLDLKFDKEKNAMKALYNNSILILN